jgi:hypothetical protein
MSRTRLRKLNAWLFAFVLAVQPLGANGRCACDESPQPSCRCVTRDIAGCCSVQKRETTGNCCSPVGSERLPCPCCKPARHDPAKEPEARPVALGMRGLGPRGIAEATVHPACRGPLDLPVPTQSRLHAALCVWRK